MRFAYCATVRAEAWSPSVTSFHRAQRLFASLSLVLIFDNDPCRFLPGPRTYEN